jgi:hypothetical protein
MKVEAMNTNNEDASVVEAPAITALTIAVEFLMCAIRELAQGQAVARRRRDDSAPGPRQHIEWALAKVDEAVRMGGL